ncbi:Kinesin-like protein KIF17 [Manis javanica]|nr:Kinesin-like protein KIF17 [Manis javanica]
MSELHRSSSAHQESCIRAGVLLVAVFLSLRTANHVKLTCCINNPNAFTFESEWHVGCDIDHVIMDFDMKQINKTKEPSETTNGHVLASHCNLVSSKCTTYKMEKRRSRQKLLIRAHVKKNFCWTRIS